MHDHGEWAEFGSRISVVYTRELRGFEASVIHLTHHLKPHANNLADTFLIAPAPDPSNPLIPTAPESGHRKLL